MLRLILTQLSLLWFWPRTSLKIFNSYSKLLFFTIHSIKLTQTCLVLKVLWIFHLTYSKFDFNFETTIGLIDEKEMTSLLVLGQHNYWLQTCEAFPHISDGIYSSIRLRTNRFSGNPNVWQNICRNEFNRKKRFLSFISAKNTNEMKSIEKSIKKLRNKKFYSKDNQIVNQLK